MREGSSSRCLPVQRAAFSFSAQPSCSARAEQRLEADLCRCGATPQALRLAAPAQPRFVVVGGVLGVAKAASPVCTIFFVSTICLTSAAPWGATSQHHQQAYLFVFGKLRLDYVDMATSSLWEVVGEPHVQICEDHDAGEDEKSMALRRAR